ncbi:MAG: prolyl oligopeptidase family serine peptidase [Clostridia bacterium]|nr:prolyl oligopeptidase family serine peptidase [Clostridia bacterium]
MDNVIRYTGKETSFGSLTGFVTLPSDYKEGEKLPMIVFLHGAGEVGDSTPETVDKVCVHGIPKYFVKNPDYKGLRVITASPQCIDGLIWDQLTLLLKAWIDEVAEKFGADTDKISITGLSMGGFGTWNMITTYPDYFSCAAPICGGGVCWRINESMKDLPIRVYHSIDDPSVPYMYSVLMTERARQHGVTVDFITYTDKGHGCWDTAYEDTDLIEWLASK